MAGAGLQVTGFDFQVSANKAAHNCSSYMGNDLVVRRGTEFEIMVKFNDTVKSEDQLTFTASLVITKGGNSILDQTFSDSSYVNNSWGAKRGPVGSTSLNITIYTPSDAVIGRYVLYLMTSGGQRRLSEFFLIFNPWDTGDAVYMAEQDQRDEYVLSEFGVIFGGDAGDPKMQPWNYGQFQGQNLYITLVLLDSTVSFRNNSYEDVMKRNDPVHICRVMSSIVNSNDDQGVLQGNWSGDYSNGTNPSAWTGSSSILKSWFENRKPVKYGQCWVFAGVLCTVSRALGIPCRIVTNYNSAHDSNGDLVIDKYFDVFGNPVDKSDDSVWNFHCWNEGWFRRPDIGVMYDGWQIFDATPQETSDGIYQLGPAARIAVKEGDVMKPYNTLFAYAEVQSDVNNYIIQKDGTTTKAKTLEAEVGLLLCTKAVGRDGYEDITDEYKYLEGTPRERDIYRKVRSTIGVSSGFMAFSADGASNSVPSRDQDISGVIRISGAPKVGEDVTVVLTLKNLKSKSKSVTVNICVAAIVYNKKVRRSILNQSVKVHLSPNEGGGQGFPSCMSCIQIKKKKTFEKEIPIEIPYSKYQGSLTTDNMINVTAVCQVEDWGDMFIEATVTLKNPPLSVQAVGLVAVGKPATIEVRFTNPLPISVSNCVLTAEGSCLTKEEFRQMLGTLESGKTMTVTFDVHPCTPGQKKLLLNFSCDRFKDIKDILTVQVVENAS